MSTQRWLLVILDSGPLITTVQMSCGSRRRNQSVPGIRPRTPKRSGISHRQRTLAPDDA